MFHHSWKSRAAAALAMMAAALFAFAGARTALAQDELDESIHVNGEVTMYLEQTTTNFNGDYTQDTRGQSAFKGYFGEGTKDTYTFTETRFKEAEVKLDKATRINDSWIVVNHIEIELKPKNSKVNPNDYDVEEASAKLQHTSGLYVHLGILQDAKLYTPGTLLDMSAGDDAGFEENPAVRVGYKVGGLNVNVRYTSMYLNEDFEDSNGDTYSKNVNQTQLRGEVEYKRKDFMRAFAYYTSISSQNKENAAYQSAYGTLAGTDQKNFKAAGLDTIGVLGLSLALEFGRFIPYANLEQWSVKQDDGATKYDAQIVTVGLNARQMGPGDLIVATEQATSDISGKDVAFSGYAAEYLFPIGEKSQHGPGFKTFSNDASGESLQGNVYYYVTKWVF